MGSFAAKVIKMSNQLPLVFSFPNRCPSFLSKLVVIAVHVVQSSRFVFRSFIRLPRWPHLVVNHLLAADISRALHEAFLGECRRCFYCRFPRPNEYLLGPQPSLATPSFALRFYDALCAIVVELKPSNSIFTRCSEFTECYLSLHHISTTANLHSFNSSP